MKNLIALFIVIFALCSCDHNEPKTFSCKQFDATCELSKDYQFVKVLGRPDSTCVDAYGELLHVDEWYIRSTKAGTLIPFQYYQEYGFSRDDFDNADTKRGSYQMKIGGEIKSEIKEIICHSTIEAAFNGRIVKVKVLLFGSRYVDAHFDGEKLSYGIYPSK